MKKEFIILLQKFLREDISSEELERLHQLHKQLDVEEKLMAEYYHQIWTQLTVSGVTNDSKAEEDKAWQVLQACIDPQPAVRIRRWLQKWRQVAAVVTIAVLFTGLGFSFSLIGTKTNKDLIVTVDNGQKAKIDLPDGSVAWLNSGSRLSYSTNFNKKDRIVNLIGEACFDVEKNPEKSFIVQTSDGLEIIALGTKFNIKSYLDDENTTSTLLEGKIQIRNKFQSEILFPNERLVFKRQDNSFVKSKVKDLEAVLSWMNNKLIFEKETLESIAKTLERVYNVEVVFESAHLKDILYSGKIKNNSLENILNLITTVSPVQYTMQDTVITFKESNNKSN